MKIIHVITVIILMGHAECFIEDTRRIETADEQRVLLRKLQNFQDPKNETKPLPWHEILADVLVNKIKIFSFKKVNNADIIKEEASSSNGILSKCFSAILLVYKNCVYDKYLTRRIEEPGYSIDHPTTEVHTDINISERDGPKSEVEIIEPKYHGKQQDSNDTIDNDEEADCPEGSTRNEKGECIDVNSKMLISVPSQCPIGYRSDGLGNCRMVF